MGRGYQVVGNVEPRKKKGEDVPQGSGVTPQTFPRRGWGRIAFSAWSRFLVSVINVFVCETNRYLRDLAGVL